MTEKTHSVYGGSTGSKWINCALYPSLITKVPRRPAGPAAYHGTAQHEVMEHLLLDPDKAPVDFLNAKMSNGVVIEERHQGPLLTALDAWEEILELYPDANLIAAEREVKLNSEAYGFTDGIIAEQSTRRGAIVDFKFGQNEVTSDDEQGLIYAVYARKSIPEFADLDEITVFIVQPAFEPVIDKTVFPISVINAFEQTIFTAIAASKKPNPLPVEGEWCKYCDAKLVCPAKTQRLATLTAPNHILDLDELGRQLKKIRAWIKWADEAEERIHHELEHGRKVPDWKLVNKRAVRVWKNEPDAILRFKRLNVPPEKYIVSKLISPAQAEEYIKKKEVDELCNKVSSGTTIAPMDDKRPEVFPAAAVAERLRRTT